MNHYETIVIFDSELSEEDLESQAEALKDRFTAGGAEISDFEQWGKRRLAYDIRRQRYGYYILYRYKAPPPLVRQTEQSLNISEQVLKYLTVRCKPGEVTPPDLLRGERIREGDGDFFDSEGSSEVNNKQKEETQRPSRDENEEAVADDTSQVEEEPDPRAEG